RRAVVDPGAEPLDIFRRPGAIAGHAARGEPFVDRLGVRAHVVVGGEIECERHRLDVAVAKQRADVLFVCDLVSHVLLPIYEGVRGRSALRGGFVGGEAADGAPVAEVAGDTGRARSSWRRSGSPSGRPKDGSGSLASSACATTSTRRTSSGRTPAERRRPRARHTHPSPSPAKRETFASAVQCRRGWCRQSRCVSTMTRLPALPGSPLPVARRNTRTACTR